MNCKQGDLAIIVKSVAGNEGKIVRCVKFHKNLLLNFPNGRKREDVCYPSGTGWKETRGFRHYVNFREVPPERWCYSVNCVVHHGGCGASMSGDNKQEAIDKWNRRT